RTNSSRMLPILAFPQIDPTLIQVGGLHIRWYGLMYVLAFVLGYLLMRLLLRRQHRLPLDDEGLGDFLFAAMLGVILGGRIGYVLFYTLPYYLANPLRAFAVWE